MIKFRVDTASWESTRRSLEDKAKALENLPANPGKNPLALTLLTYRNALRKERRPTVSSSGAVAGEKWAGYPSAYVSHIRKNGTRVPVWPFPRAKGKGKTLGRKKSSAVASGAGSRYKPSDRQMGDRAGGFWSDWITQKPQITGTGNRTARISSPFKYSAAITKRRPVWGRVTERLARRALRSHMLAYYRKVLHTPNGRGAR